MWNLLATYAPDSITQIVFGPLYYDHGWILTETQWLMPDRFQPLPSSNDVIFPEAPLPNGLESWGANSRFVLNVQKSDCDFYPSQMFPVSSLSGISTKDNKYLLKLSMPQLKGCVEYNVKVWIIDDFCIFQGSFLIMHQCLFHVLLNLTNEFCQVSWISWCFNVKWA